MTVDGFGGDAAAGATTNGTEQPRVGTSRTEDSGDAEETADLMADVAGALDLLDRMITQDRERRALADDLARGRDVPGWLVTIEARLAAGDAVEAARRTSYPLLPLARFGSPAGGGRDMRLDLRPPGTVASLEAKVEELAEADVDSAEA